MNSSLIARNARIRVLRERGNTLESIAQQYGLTRERVRQITIDIPGPERCITKKKAAAHDFRINFKRSMLDWLKSFGWRKCAQCGNWKSWPGPKSNRCRECNRSRAGAHYQTDKGKDYAQRYKKEHPDVNRRAANKFYSRLRADPNEWKRYLEKRRERSNAVMNDPEKAEQVREQWRLAYKKRAAQKLETNTND